MTVIPAASILGGAGTGEGEGGKGSGGGFGLAARPAGAFVIKDGKVRWIGAVDVNRAILGGQIVGVVALLTLRTLIKAAKRRRPRGLPGAQERNEDGGRVARILEMARLRNN